MDNSREMLDDKLINRFSINKEEVDLIVTDVENVIANTRLKDIQKKILQEMDIHLRANDYIEEEVRNYRERIYNVAKQIAQTESENDIITKSHASKAKEMIWRKKTKFDFSDAFLGIGGLLLGAGLPHILDLLQKTPTPQPNAILLVLNIIGALAFGMGIVFKAKT